MLLKGKLLTIIIAIEVVVIVALILKIFSNFQLQKTAMIVYTKEMENGKYKYFGVCDVTRRISDDKDLYVELIPDMHVMCPRGNKTIYIDINSQGFRDREFTLSKPPNTIRILAMGDSWTYGWYVNLNDTWPKRLEKLLNERRSKLKFEVFNLGVPGYDIWNVANLFVKKGYIYNPDILLISFIDNDVAPEPQVCFSDCVNVSSNKSECKIVCHLDILYKFTHNKTHITEFVNKSLKLLRSKYDGKVYLIMFPLSNSFYEEILENLAKNYDIKICNMHEIYKKWPIEELVLDKEYDYHPNEFAYSLIAERVFQCLKDSELLFLPNER
jgi:lysophospholipase L1-like esterase